MNAELERGSYFDLEFNIEPETDQWIARYIPHRAVRDWNPWTKKGSWEECRNALMNFFRANTTSDTNRLRILEQLATAPERQEAHFYINLSWSEWSIQKQ